MTKLYLAPVKTLMTALLLSGAMLASPALAQTSPLTSSTVAQTLPELSPEQIAADVVREFDPQTGTRIFKAPTFDPFELDESLAGTAALRTGSLEKSLDGAPLVGGAFLDLSMIYTTASDDPYDIREFGRAVYVSSEPVSRSLQDVKTLDCSENTREIVYDDNYDRGSSYGYLAGLYVLLPRYRGHRGFGHRGYGHGYRGRGYGHYGRRGRGGYGYGGGHRGRGGDGTGRGRGRGGDDTGRARRDRDDYVAPRKRNKKGGSITSVYRPRPDLNREVRGRDSGSTDRPRRRPGRAVSPARDKGRIDRPISKRVTTSVSKPRPNPVSRPVSRPTSRPVSRPVSRPAPSVQSKPQTRSKPVSKPVSRPVSKPNRSRVDRAVDRSFKSRGKSGKHMNFFPVSSMAGQYSGAGYTRTDVYSSYRCVRDERVSLHIPQDRLDAARFDGLTIILIDRNDQEVPVYLPPNYIEGFRKAVQGYGGAVTPPRSSAYTPSGSYDGATTTIYSPDQPARQSSYPLSGN